jgi:predicted nucleic acid-binding Zn ribbon protein
MVDQDTVHGYVKQAGHCTRCGDPFGGNRTTAFMVRERIIWRDNPWDGPSIFWQWETVPACEACVTPKEQDETTRSIICKGCGLSMLLPEHRRRRRTGGWLTGRIIEQTCSTRCAQRERRSRQHQKKRHCATCGMLFKAVRIDAKFCSNACRQKAHR